MRKIVMVLALLVVTGLFALKQYGENEKNAQPKAPEVWENVRKVYDFAQSAQVDADLSRLGTAGFQIVACRSCRRLTVHAFMRFTTSAACGSA
jgi:hypothetical protein